MPSPDDRTARWRGTETLIAAVAAIVAAVVALALVNRKPQSSGKPLTAGDTVRHRPISGGEFEISGVAHVPNSNRVVDGHALVVPIKLVDPARPFSRSNIRADGPAVRLDLGGNGIRSLEYDVQSKA